ncbi:hypothetical protein BJ912DRAFT_961047 [Pholiota molesta]|nr:hypothetical protein BJ912DRAFT_961047 [Pholiota molesta]
MRVLCSVRVLSSVRCAILGRRVLWCASRDGSGSLSAGARAIGWPGDASSAGWLMAVVVLVCFWAPVCAVLVEFLLCFRFCAVLGCAFFSRWCFFLSLGDAVMFFLVGDVVCGMSFVGWVRFGVRGGFFASRLRDGRMPFLS